MTNDQNSAQPVVYWAMWCPDCRRSKQFLDDQRIQYLWVDIDKDPKAREYIESVNEGKTIIPTIVFADGSILVEPTNAELAQKLKAGEKAKRSAYDQIVIGGGPSALAASGDHRRVGRGAWPPQPAMATPQSPLDCAR